MQYESSVKKVGKKGWTQQETDRLLREAELAQSEGLPLKAVFERVAQITGRKPDSIRNYYYTKIKEINPHIKMAFTPFTQEEVDLLFREMLLGQAAGKSVRKIALEMGKNDKKTMLRYQNKYRSVLKNDPDYVEDMVHKLEAEGLLNKADLELKKRSYQRRDSGAVVTAFMETVVDLGKEGQQMLSALESAFQKQKMQLKDTGRVSQEKKKPTLGDQYEALKQQYMRLEKINTEFLARNAMERISTLPEYVDTLKNCIG